MSIFVLSSYVAYSSKEITVSMFLVKGCTTFAVMNPRRAITELQRLASEASAIAAAGPGPLHELWKTSVSTVLNQTLGQTSEIGFRFRSVRYRHGVESTAPDARSRNARVFSDRVQMAVALIHAAIYELGLTSENDLNSNNYDPDLWNHVQHSINEERWEQVASAAATFVEDKVRRWGGTPLNESGGVLVGQALFATVLAEDGPLALGSQTAETTGWRSLGMGFAGALSNVDRHRIQEERPDLKQYAIGVLGLASLLLTQIRYKHPEAVL
jgi:hypothetical protein